MDWYWVERKNNVADLVTWGASIRQLKNGSIWQNGPEFFNLHESKWPVEKL